MLHGSWQNMVGNSTEMVRAAQSLLQMGVDFLRAQRISKSAELFPVVDFQLPIIFNGQAGENYF